MLVACEQESTGATPLFVASESGHVRVVQALLEMGKDTDVNQARVSGWSWGQRRELWSLAVARSGGC